MNSAKHIMTSTNLIEEAGRRVCPKPAIWQKTGEEEFAKSAIAWKRVYSFPCNIH